PQRTQRNSAKDAKEVRVFETLPVSTLKFMVKTSVITIRDVAKESGFSSTTVSIVLNDAPLARYIPPATKKRIEKAAKKLGYRPNIFARSLRSKRSHT